MALLTRNESTTEDLVNESSFSITKVALGFACAAALAAFFLTPVLDGGLDQLASDPGVDRTVVGSIKPADRSNGNKRYTVRRSVLQSNPTEPCVIFADGSQQGAC